MEFRAQSASFHPSSINSTIGGVGSFNSNSLARMESKFCKNFVCCSIPLDDLHDLLEHFEQAHCSSLTNPHQRPSSSSSSCSSHRHDIVFEDENEWRSRDDETEEEEGSRELEVDEESAEDDEIDSNSCPVHHPPGTGSNSYSAYGSSTRGNMLSNLVASFHDSLGIPPSLLNGHYQPENSTEPSRIHPQIHPDLFGPTCDSGLQTHATVNRAESIHDFWRIESQRSRMKDSNLRKRYADCEWDHDFLSPTSIGSTEHRPFKCSVPGCEKAYKQQNGLKYHKAHGHSSQRELGSEEESKTIACHDSVSGKMYKK
ncbi:expressed protein [Phakopsora pachyrhizi]|uniref:Expressed protein n=1 Tax=Phakopsora pachyrhizi TaxID=170000 RepID=A0AAV0B177_PHAPC|nr:expressed protein [Phakopsora pachyrhizi]CAH7676637.1 expressed protein [Phakopsora pachyrhizi]